MIFMEKELRFGLNLGRSPILKKRVWVDYEQLLNMVFSCFQRQKKVLFFFKRCSVPTKKLHKMKWKEMFFSFEKNQKEFSFWLFYRLRNIFNRDTSPPRDLSIITLDVIIVQFCILLIFCAYLAVLNKAIVYKSCVEQCTTFVTFTCPIAELTWGHFMVLPWCLLIFCFSHQLFR